MRWPHIANGHSDDSNHRREVQRLTAGPEGRIIVCTYAYPRTCIGSHEH